MKEGYSSLCKIFGDFTEEEAIKFLKHEWGFCRKEEFRKFEILKSLEIYFKERKFFEVVSLIQTKIREEKNE
jgi:hypothetical protein